MKRVLMYMICFAALLLPGSAAIAQDDGEPIDQYSIWFGGHVIDFEDYTKKVGEYLKFDEDLMPEFRIDYLSRFENGFFTLDGHYFDDEDVDGELNVTAGNVFRANAHYRSLIHQLGQDMLGNLMAREFLPETGNPGGKMVTSELLDPGADYNVHRQEILAQFSGMLSMKNNVRLRGIHRSIFQDGHAQAISSNHCFSCHQVSQTREVDNQQHQFEVGLDATINKVDVGYSFGYRKFESDATPPTGFYDPAKHPVHGGVAEEFTSRLSFSDTSLPIHVLPETEKLSHKLRAKSDVGQGLVVGKLGYSRAENKGTDLTADAFTGSVKYTTPLSPRTRLIATVIGARLTADDIFIDVPTFRRDRPGLKYSSDFTRYSALDRYDGRATAEVIHRPNPRMTLAILGGIHVIDRDDYPIPGDGDRATTITGQAKWRYRKSLTYSTYVKYRFEKTSDPLTSARGLFEYVGRDSLQALPGAPNNLKFYFQREGIRYQDVTSLPTDEHIFAWRSNYRPSNSVSLGLGIQGKYDQNNDLDSLEVEHFALTPDINLNYMPSMQWVLTTGYTYNYNKSRIPVAVALFDG